MKIYTHYSDSHSEMFEKFFVKSLEEVYPNGEVEIKAHYHAQTAPSGAFMSHGWLDTMDIKLDVILSAIEENMGEKFIFSDVDVQFFKPFLGVVEDELNVVDITCQEDRGTMCAGFFGCCGNQKTMDLFKLIKQHFRNLSNDQVALNHFGSKVVYSLLNKDQFYTIGNFILNPNGTSIWDGHSEVIPPKDMLIHHANYVVGSGDKLRLLEMVRRNYDNQLL